MESYPLEKQSIMLKYYWHDSLYLNQLIAPHHCYLVAKVHLKDDDRFAGVPSYPLHHYLFQPDLKHHYQPGNTATEDSQNVDQQTACLNHYRGRIAHLQIDLKQPIDIENSNQNSKNIPISIKTRASVSTKVNYQQAQKKEES